MRLFTSLFLILLIATCVAGAAVRPDTVVAKVNGKELTAADVETLLAGAPADLRDTLRKDKKAFLQQYALVERLAEAGDEEGLADKPPFNEQLEWSRMQVLLQAAIAQKDRQLRVSGKSAQETRTAMRQWMEELDKKAEVSFENDPFFSSDLSAAAEVPPDTVVAKVNGKPATAGEIEDLIRGAPSSVVDNFKKDRKQFLREYAMMLLLVDVANSENLASASPYREQLDWVRTNVLAQAKMNAYSDSIVIGREQEKEYYEAHQDDYTQAQVKVIYIPFASADQAAAAADGEKKVLTEDEARELAEKIRKEIASGADFVDMVRQYSQDEASKAKDGDFEPISRTQKIPENIKDAIFSRQAGEVTDPILQPNGYYLFRVEKIGLLTIDEVRQTMNPRAKAEKFNEWINAFRQSVEVTIENQEYFDDTGTP